MESCIGSLKWTVNKSQKKIEIENIVQKTPVYGYKKMEKILQKANRKKFQKFVNWRIQNFLF